MKKKIGIFAVACGVSTFMMMERMEKKEAKKEAIIEAVRADEAEIEAHVKETMELIDTCISDESHFCTAINRHKNQYVCSSKEVGTLPTTIYVFHSENDKQEIMNVTTYFGYSFLIEKGYQIPLHNSQFTETLFEVCQEVKTGLSRPFKVLETQTVKSLFTTPQTHAEYVEETIKTGETLRTTELHLSTIHQKFKLQSENYEVEDELLVRMKTPDHNSEDHAHIFEFEINHDGELEITEYDDIRPDNEIKPFIDKHDMFSYQAKIDELIRLQQ